VTDLAAEVAVAVEARELGLVAEGEEWVVEVGTNLALVR